MRKNIIILVSCVIIISCNKTDNDLLEKLDSYPLKVGNEWTYMTETVLKEYDSELFDRIINIDTNFHISHVIIKKDTVLKDLIEVKQVRTITNNTISDRYINLDSEGLKQFGYFNQGFKSIYIHETPKLEIKLPLYRNSVWNYGVYQYPELISIEKKVIGSEILKIGNKDFLCFKIQIFNDNFPGHHFFEWISKEGLIKKQEIYDKSELIFVDGSKYMQITNTTTLTNMILN